MPKIPGVNHPTEYDDDPGKPLPAADAFDIVSGDFPELAERLGC